jgi:hypothetical protein
MTPCTFVHETARLSLKDGNRGVTGGGGGVATTNGRVQSVEKLEAK